MLTDLVQIRRLGEQKHDENLRFRAWMKRHRYPDRQFRRIAGEIESAIDCTACANCCRVGVAGLNRRDVERIASHLGMSEAQFLADCTTSDETGDLLLKKTESGCVFLEGNLCGIYDFRPRSCQGYPHLLSNAGSLESRMWSIVERAACCPIVYNALEAWKDETSFNG